MYENSNGQADILSVLKFDRSHSKFNGTQMILLEMLEIMKERQTTQKRKEKKKLARSDWMLVAMVMDRFLLIVFVTVTILLNVTTLFYPQMSLESDFE